MPMTQQPERSHRPDAQQQKYPTKIYVIFGIVVIVVVVVGAVVIWVVGSKGSWSTIVFAILAGLLSVLVAVVQWLWPLAQKKEPSTPEATSLPSRSVPTPQERVINTPDIHQEITNALHIERQLQSDKGPTNIAKTDSGPLQLPPLPKAAFSYQPPLSPEMAFPYNQPLKNIKEFFGRTREVQTLLDRTRKGSSTSIVGASGIGKTWLMRYFGLIARAELGSNFRIGYLDATSPQCSTIATFTVNALQALGVPSTASGSDAWGLVLLDKAVKELKLLNQTPILCIDEFHGFGGKRGFDLKFFDNLRAITYSGLVLIVASKLPLVEIVVGTMDREAITSPFFNIFTQVKLKPFSVKEAQDFVQAKAKQVGLDDRECTLLLNCAAIDDTNREKQWSPSYDTSKEKQWPPSRLQLAGRILLQDKLRNPQRIGSPDYWRVFLGQLDRAYADPVAVVYEQR